MEKNLRQLLGKIWEWPRNNALVPKLTLFRFHDKVWELKQSGTEFGSGTETGNYVRHFYILVVPEQQLVPFPAWDKMSWELDSSINSEETNYEIVLTADLAQTRCCS